MAKASGFPWPWNPGLDKTWVRFGNLQGSGGRGEYSPAEDLIRVNPVGQGFNPDYKSFYEALNHELAHPTQDILQEDYYAQPRTFGGNPYTYPKGLAPKGIKGWFYWKHPFMDYSNLSYDQRYTNLPEGHNYEEPFAYWVGQYSIGKPIPPAVKKVIEESVYYKAYPKAQQSIKRADIKYKLKPKDTAQELADALAKEFNTPIRKERKATKGGR